MQCNSLYTQEEPYSILAVSTMYKTIRTQQAPHNRLYAPGKHNL